MSLVVFNKDDSFFSGKKLVSSRIAPQRIRQFHDNWQMAKCHCYLKGDLPLILVLLRGALPELLGLIVKLLEVGALWSMAACVILAIKIIFCYNDGTLVPVYIFTKNLNYFDFFCLVQGTLFIT